MVVELCDNCEYTELIADVYLVMVHLQETGNNLFTLKVWMRNNDLPFVFENHCDFKFMQEGLRIEDGRGVYYIWYDTIEYMSVLKE